jgi:carbon storage regulator CsrA
MVIAGDIKVTIIDIRRGRVRLGIEAPPEVSVQRSELLSPGRRHDPATCEICLPAVE